MVDEEVIHSFYLIDELFPEPDAPHGVLGIEFLRKYRVQIDMDKDKLCFPPDGLF